MSFEKIAQKINAKRAELAKTEFSFEFIDFGAGARDENRSEADMQKGVKLKKSLKDFAFIGIKDENASWLFEILKAKSPKVILELGCCLGFSGLLFKHASPKSKLYTLEGDKTLARLARQNFKDFGFDDVSVICGRFEDSLKELLPKILIDFAFIDGHHDRKATLEYFACILPFMASDGIMAFDDIDYNQNMQKAWLSIKESAKISGFKAVDNGRIGLLFLGGKA